MFCDCTALKNITLPKSIEQIGNYAFISCKSLEKIVLYENVTSIGEDAFAECDNLTIYGMKDSYAEQYANEHNIPFEELD